MFCVTVFVCASPSCSKNCTQPLSHFVPLAVCSGRHQAVLDVLAAVLAGALEVEMLLQLLLAISRRVEEVHVADGQLLTLGDVPQSSQLDPEREEVRIVPAFLDLILLVIFVKMSPTSL